MTDRIAAAKAAIDRAEAMKAMMKGTCSDCRFSKWASTPTIAKCSNPIAAVANMGMIAGATNHPHASSVRSSYDGLCGPEGLLFEPKTLTRSFLDRLFGSND